MRLVHIDFLENFNWDTWVRLMDVRRRRWILKSSEKSKFRWMDYILHNKRATHQNNPLSCFRFIYFCDLLIFMLMSRKLPFQYTPTNGNNCDSLEIIIRIRWSLQNQFSQTKKIILRYLKEESIMKTGWLHTFLSAMFNAQFFFCCSQLRTYCTRQDVLLILILYLSLQFFIICITLFHMGTSH